MPSSIFMHLHLSTKELVSSSGNGSEKLAVDADWQMGNPAIKHAVLFCLLDNADLSTLQQTLLSAK